MGSFKLRLVIYFMLLALLPLVAATVAFSEVAERGETGSVDSRLSTAIRVAQPDYEEQLNQDASRNARSLARATQVPWALENGTRSVLVTLANQFDHTAVYSADGELLAGEPPGPFDGVREVSVKGSDRKLLGRVVAHLPFSDALVKQLEGDAALDGGDRFAFVADGRVIFPNAIRGELNVPHQEPRFVSVDGVRYRALGTELIEEGPGRRSVALVALSPKADIDEAVGSLRDRFLLFSAVAMIAVGILAYTFGRTIVRSLAELAAAAGAIAKGKLEQRVPVRGRDEFAALGSAFNDMAAQLEQRVRELDAERGRVRDTIARFGDALAATHEPYALLPVIVQNTVEATGAAGARLVVDGKEIAREGTPPTADGRSPSRSARTGVKPASST